MQLPQLRSKETPHAAVLKTIYSSRRHTTKLGRRCTTGILTATRRMELGLCQGERVMGLLQFTADFVRDAGGRRPERDGSRKRRRLATRAKDVGTKLRATSAPKLVPAKKDFPQAPRKYNKYCRREPSLLLVYFFCRCRTHRATQFSPPLCRTFLAPAECIRPLMFCFSLQELLRNPHTHTVAYGYYATQDLRNTEIHLPAMCCARDEARTHPASLRTGTACALQLQRQGQFLCEQGSAGLKKNK